MSACTCGDTCRCIEQRRQQQRREAHLLRRMVRCEECGTARMAAPVTDCERHPGAAAVIWGQPELAAWRYISSEKVRLREDLRRFLREFEERPSYWPGVLPGDLERVGELFLRWGGRVPDEAPPRTGPVSPRGLFG